MLAYKNSIKKILITSVSAGVLICTSGAWAQTTEKTSRDVTRLKRIVKGAGQDKVAVETPQAVTVLEQSDIDDEAPTTVGDLFDQIPGVTTSGSESALGESFNIRGVGAGETQADEGRFIISVDGVDKNYQQYRLGGFFSDPELYKRLEVLRGPASSTLYGSGALAGSVLFTTKDASDFLDEGQTYSVRLKGAYESNAKQGLGSTTLAWRPLDTAEFLLTGNYRKGDDYFTGNGSTIQAALDTFSGLAKGTFYFGDNNEKVLRASYQKWLSDAENQPYAQTVNSTGFGTVDRKLTDEQFLVSWEDPFDESDMLDLKVQVSHSETFNQQRNSFISSSNGDFIYETWQGKVENTSYFSGDSWENYTTYGLQYTNLDRRLGLVDTGAQPEGSDKKIAGFIQSEFTLGDNLTLIPGLRIDHRTLTPDNSVITGFGSADEISETAISPKFAALYDLNDRWNIFGSYAHTERLGTIDEIYDYRTGSTPGYNLEREKSDNFEIGVGYSDFGVWSDDDSLQVKATAFYNSVRDYITDNPNSSSRSKTGEANINIPKVEFYGAEVEFSYERTNWYINGGGSIIRGIDTNNFFSTSGHLNNIPPDELFFTIGGKVEEKGINYGLKTRLIAAQKRIVDASNNRKEAPAFALNDVFINWVPEKEGYNGFEFRASIENIFNIQHQEFLSNNANPGRNFKFSLVKEFGS